jgi:ribosomal protein S18 acetylase RimI-like enzyme
VIHDILLPGITIERATAADADAVLAILQDAARWLLSRGIEQWRPEHFQREPLLRHIARGEVFVARRARVPVGTLSLSWDDLAVWGEQPPIAGYVHGLAISRSEGGHGLGRALLDWASRRTAAAGKPLLRLDCMTDNPALRVYYERPGFTYLRDASDWSWSASLYERPTGAAMGETTAEEPMGTGTLTIRLAEPGEVETLVTIEESAGAWLRTRGIDPGQPPKPLREIMAERVRKRVVYLALLDGRPAGTLTLLWGPEEVWADLPGDAAYVHGLMVHRDFAGLAVGRRMLAWAEAQARAADKPLLRLDCDALNPALRAYYERAGFTPRGEVTLAHRVAARYERLAQRPAADLHSPSPRTERGKGGEDQPAGEAGLATTSNLPPVEEGGENPQ